MTDEEREEVVCDLCGKEGEALTEVPGAGPGDPTTMLCKACAVEMGVEAVPEPEEEATENTEGAEVANEKVDQERAQEEREAALSPEAKEILVKARREIEHYWRERDKEKDQQKADNQSHNRKVSMYESFIETEIAHINLLFEKPPAQTELPLEGAAADVNDVPFVPPEETPKKLDLETARRAVERRLKNGPVTATFNGQEMSLEEAAQKLSEGALESAELNKVGKKGRKVAGPGMGIEEDPTIEPHPLP